MIETTKRLNQFFKSFLTLFLLKTKKLGGDSKPTERIEIFYVGAFYSAGLSKAAAQ